MLVFNSLGFLGVFLFVFNFIKSCDFTENVTSKDFDMILLVCLIRNTTTEPAPPTGWDDLPDEVNITKTADVARIKYYRNEYLTHKPRPELSNAEFQTACQSLIGVSDNIM